MTLFVSHIFTQNCFVNPCMNHLCTFRSSRVATLCPKICIKLHGQVVALLLKFQDVLGLTA
jgi:hypothetical protein